MYYNTKGNASPRGKVNAFFTAHPADFEESYERICADLLEADEEIAVWYLTEEERAAYDPELLRTDLGCMDMISVTYCRAGDLSNAIGFEEEAAEHALNTYGPDHPVSLHILRNLVSYYLAEGSNEEAKETLETLIDSYKRIYGEEASQTMQLKDLLATL